MIIDLILLVIVLASLFVFARMLAKQGYKILRETLLPVKETGALPEDGKFAAMCARLNITSKEQLDRYIKFSYLNSKQFLEKKKVLKMTVVFIAVDLLVGFVVALALRGDYARKFWLDIMFVPLIIYILIVFTFPLAMTLIFNTINRRSLDAYEEYLGDLLDQDEPTL